MITEGCGPADGEYNCGGLATDKVLRVSVKREITVIVLYLRSI